jgi:hypothetical protein
MPANKARVINYLIPSPPVCHQILWTLFFLMFGDLPQHLLVDTSIMFHLLMILANLLGSISCVTNLKYFNANGSSIEKFVLCKPIGEENINH